ncbi:MAG: hypothetical protein ACFB0B_17015 [Thermonemataceae bacterium]
MGKQINLTAIEQYSQTLAERTTADFFPDKTHIKGKELLNFCSFKQINLFLIKILFEKWQNSIEASKSPYFDYEHPTVRKAFQQYANVLSQHISVSRDLLVSLVQQATYETIILLLDPFEFYINEIDKFEQETVAISKLKEIQKYIVINKIFFQELLQDLAKSPEEEIPTTELITSFKIVFQINKEEVEDYTAYTSTFDILHPVQLSTFFKEEAEETPSTPETSEPITDIPTTTEEETPTTTPLVSVETDEEEEEKEIDSDTLNDRFKQNKYTLNDHLRTKSNSIRNDINLNQRFRFINQLFRGNYTSFNQFISEIEQLDDKEEVLRKFEEQRVKLGWNNNTKETEDLLKIIDAYFEAQ